MDRSFSRTPIVSGNGWPAGIRRKIEIGADGLVFGADVRLVRMTEDEGLALDADRARLLALLSVTFGRPVAAGVLGHVAAASGHWQRGDKALANLRLIFADLPRLDDFVGVYRLQLAEYLLDQGIAPHALMKELELDTSALDLVKYDPDQPRVPAGNGRESGRWGPGSGSLAFLGPVASAFLADASAKSLASLAEFAARFSVPTAVLGALFIPTPNSGGVTDGVLPDAPDISFEKDDPAGTLRLTARGSDGSEIVVVGQNQRGLYVDIRTGQSIGRDLGGQLYLDLDAVRDAIDDRAPQSSQGEPDGRPKAAADEPKLCPAPTDDKGHGSSERAKAYENDVHARVNPIAPIPREFGVNVLNPLTGKSVFFDDCFRYTGDLVDGDMKAGDLVEAKGERYEYLYSKDWPTAMDDNVTQAQNQLEAADARGVGLKWYFAEKGAAATTREWFRGRGLERIVIGYVPPRGRR